MIRITQQARDHIQDLLREYKIDDWGFTLSVDDIHCAGLHYGIDFSPKPTPDQTIIELDGVKVFIKNEQLGFFEDILIDWSIAGISKGLVVVNGAEQGIVSKACGSIHGCSCSAKTKIEGTAECITCQ